MPAYHCTVLNDLIPHDYDKRVHPQTFDSTGREIPLGIEITINVTTILMFNSAKNSFNADMIIKQKWQDHRLTFPQVTSNNSTVLHLMSRETIDRLWSPDLFVVNSRQMTHITPMFFEVDLESHSVICISRQIIKMSCAMNVFAYPLDHQVCSIEFSLYKKPKQIAYLKFADDHSDKLLEMDNFGIVISHTDEHDCRSQVTRGQHVFSCVSLQLNFSRRVSYYLVQMYAPSFIIAVSAFLGFWTPSGPGYASRCYLSLVLIYALTLQSVIINKEINVSSMLSINIWITINIVFVFGTLIQAVVAVMYTHSAQDSMDARDSESGINRVKRKSFAVRTVDSMLHSVYGNISFKHRFLVYNKIDLTARIVFPIAYFIFLIIYMLCFFLPWLLYDPVSSDSHPVGHDE